MTQSEMCVWPDIGTTRAAVLDVDRRLDPRFARHVQANVGVQARVRRGGPASYPPQDFLNSQHSRWLTLHSNIGGEIKAAIRFLNIYLF